MDLFSDGIGGVEAGQVISGNERYDIYVRLAKAWRKDVETMKQLVLQAPGGAWVRLGEIADVSIESGPPQIRRDDMQRRVVIQSNVDGRDMGGLVSELPSASATRSIFPPVTRSSSAASSRTSNGRSSA